MRGTINRARQMLQRQGTRGRNHGLLWLTAACFVLIGLVLNVYARASGDSTEVAGSLALSSAGPGLAMESHDPGLGHAGGGHCLTGDCTSPMITDPTVLRVGKQAQPFDPADASPRHQKVRPPLRPPKGADLG
jgi:hypothetical protein